MRKAHAALALILAFGLVAYWPGLAGPLLFDDDRNLQPIRDWLAGDSTWLWVVTHNNSGPLGRPVSMASFIINVWITGPGVWGLKLGNVVLHAFNCVLVYALVRRLVSLRALLTHPSTNAVRWLPVVGAAIWFLHPLLVSTVLYVVQRMAILGTTFVLGAMLAYLAGRTALSEGKLRRAIAFFLTATISTILGLLCKENAVVALPLCGLIELLVFTHSNHRNRHIASWSFIIFTLLVPAVSAVLLVILKVPYISEGYLHRPFTLDQRLLTQPRVLWTYVGSWLLPYGPRLGIFHDDFVVSRSLVAPFTTTLAIVCWSALLIIAWRSRQRVPGLALGLGVFLIGHSIESTIFPLLLYFEHRNYLPTVGLVCVLLTVAGVIWERLDAHLRHANAILIAAPLLLCIALGLATAARSGIWGSRTLIHQQGLMFHPDSRWLRVDMAEAAMKAKPPRYDEALKHAMHLENLSDPSTRRLGAALRFILACMESRTYPKSSLELLFEGRPEPLEADLLLAMEKVADAALVTSCPQSPGSLAKRMDHWLDASALPDSDLAIRRLRFKVAQLYLHSGNIQGGLTRAASAYRGEYYDAPVGIFIADILIGQGRYPLATRYLGIAEKSLPPEDTVNRSLIIGLHAAIEARTSNAKLKD